MKVTELLTRGIAALAFAASAVTTTATLTAAPAKADISCPDRVALPSVSPDCYFLDLMALHHIPLAGSQEDSIAKAHNMCMLMDRDTTGADPVYDVAVLFQQANPKATIAQAAFITNIAAVAYCPWNIRQ